ncbi:MAG: hypothetical protein K8T89_18925 [Planctomycetes bacterium]|nr:hypothetical protein [Planctomycetota bacterium]
MNTHSTRDELLSALAELGRLFPDWRLGQTIANLTMAAGHLESGAVWDLKDGEALAAARRLIERNVGRLNNKPVETLQETAAL